jgi:hypothetical protein
VCRTCQADETWYVYTTSYWLASIN